MTDFTKEISDALTEIKTSVDAKFKDTALAADVEKAIADASKVTADEVVALKSALEALEAKLDAIPTPAIFKKKEEQNMNVNAQFEKSLAAGGKAELELVLKNITATTNITGAPVDTFGLTGTSFAANPFRMLAANIESNSKAIVLPILTGNHGAAAANTTVRGELSGGSASVSEISIMATTFEALTKVSIEAANDIIGLDQFWAQNMINELGSKEALAHVAVVEGIAGVTSSANTGIDLDDLADLHFSVEPQYRANGNFVVSTGVMRTIRTLNTASTGGDLVYDAKDGVFRLFGQPIYENAYMAPVAAGNVVAAYGDFKQGMVIMNRSSASVGRYAETSPGYYTYYGSLRSGAAGWHSAAVKTLTVAA